MGTPLQKGLGTSGSILEWKWGNPPFPPPPPHPRGHAARQTPVKTLLSHRSTYAGSKNNLIAIILEKFVAYLRG